ncbi:MAG: hypothetical protein QOJ89_1508 [bacterium]
MLVAALLPAALAVADVAGPDDTIATAYGPLVAGTPYSGTFKSETDVDYLSFDVAKAGDKLHFDVVNTVSGCTSVNLTGCPIYATLITTAGQQVGGEGSSAGTAAVPEGRSDTIDWTFDAPGRYLVAMDSDGDGPTYTIRYRVVTAAAGTGTTVPRPAAISSLRVTTPQHTTTVRARLNVGRVLRKLTVRLERAGAARGAAPVAVARLEAVPRGKRTISLRLDARARADVALRGHLALRVRVVAVPDGGATQILQRAVRVDRR